MNYMKFNMNNSVKVKLNNKGYAELERQHNELYSYIGIKKEYKKIATDDEGYSTFQMHTLMSTFGHMMVLGCEAPFETLTIKIAEVNLKSAN